jgi:DNA recombination protein RmuC
MDIESLNLVMVVLALLLVLALGLAGWCWARFVRARADRDASLAARSDLERRLVAETEALNTLRDDHRRLIEDWSGHKATLAAREAEFASREALMLQGMQAAFKATAGDALTGIQQQFLALARQSFETSRTQTSENLSALLGPMAETFGIFRAKVEELQRVQAEDRSGLAEQLRAVNEAIARSSAETSKLTTALQTSPKTRGAWGEQQLRNVLELAGLQAHVDFVEQVHASNDLGETLRPDVVIRMPQGRAMVVDAKVALAGFLAASAASTSEARTAGLRDHARQVRAHMEQLSKRNYDAFVGGAVDFVAMFVPGDAFYAAALEEDPALFDDAVRKRVLIVTPVTLIALAKSVAWGWRHEQREKNAADIARLGAELYERIVRLSEHLGKLGRQIEGSVRSYNDAVGSLDSRVAPAARRLAELGIQTGRAALPEVAPIDQMPREPSRADNASPMLGSGERDLAKG